MIISTAPGMLAWPVSCRYNKPIIMLLLFCGENDSFLWICLFWPTYYQPTYFVWFPFSLRTSTWMMIENTLVFSSPFWSFLLDFLKPYSRRLTKTYHDFPLHTMLTRCDIWCILYGKSIFFLFTTKNNFLKFTFIEKMKEWLSLA